MRARCKRLGRPRCPPEAGRRCTRLVRVRVGVRVGVRVRVRVGVRVGVRVRIRT